MVVMNNNYKIGLDVGSTTAKIVVLNNSGDVVFNKYVRHNTKIAETTVELFDEVKKEIGESRFRISITGSAGYGLCEKLDIPFVQEVIATTVFVKQKYPEVKTLVDIGGEDSKMIFFSDDRAPDIRMNGSCAGGTGAFIDQIASLLNIPTSDLNELAKKHQKIYPIASRCGVFAKTDIQNLLSRKIPLPDIAISTFQAVVVQTMNTLARGFDVLPKVMFIGGPFMFLSELKRLFIENLKITPEDVVETEHSLYVPAFGTALSVEDEQHVFTAETLKNKIKLTANNTTFKNRLNPLFKDEEERKQWMANREKMKVKRVSLKDYDGELCFMGIDSGSTTSKIAIIGQNKELLFHYYVNNNGNSVKAIEEGLALFDSQMKSQRPGRPLKIIHATSTGYGEDLIKAAFGLPNGVVETIAHFTAARNLDPQVSFIMDIGGQDMKALFVNDGVINRIELNESCSSGCGSFIQTFGNTLGFTVGDFATRAMNALNPSDLGTRCTVFMNSKVKQSLRENASIEDISAGLAISVIKNALYKVLKLRDADILGDHIVVQGGTFKNPAVHRALEVLTKKSVKCSDMPEMMGAYGAALISLNSYLQASPEERKFFEPVKTLNGTGKHKTKMLHCKGCTNNCSITRFTFENGHVFYSGNKCENIFSNSGEKREPGFSMPDYKYRLLFDRPQIKSNIKKPVLRYGIPRVLNMYENYPFWNKLLTSLGFEVVLSDESNSRLYENGQGTIMSDNVCFPAKLVHGHILSLAEKKVDRILYPLEFFQKNEFEKSDNSYMCPVVSGYAEVIRNSINPEKRFNIPIDEPVINYKDEKLLYKSIYQLLKGFGIKKSAFNKAFAEALTAQNEFKEAIRRKGAEIIAKTKNSKEDKITVVLAGRPYHSDPLINHKIPSILVNLGVDVLTEDAVPQAEKSGFEQLQVISQWSYPNRVYNAAQWVAEQDERFQFVQLNSFGCGPDAIVVDEAAAILQTGNKIHTVLKIDDINSMGSVKLRLRSLLESLKIRETEKNAVLKERARTPEFTEDDKERVILGPHFSDFYSPFLPAVFKLAGYKYVNLPPSTKKSVEYGLKYSNNEICYPATLVVGDVIHALDSGKYDRKKVAVGITQTGGQCRATSYLSLIKKGMIAAGYGDVPIVAIGTSGKTLNPQPGFKINWKKILPITLAGTLFADAMSKMFYSTVIREKEKGVSKQLMDKYYNLAYGYIENADIKGLYALLENAVEEFNMVDVDFEERPKIGIVGEIYIKYNNFGNNHIINWLIEQGVEVKVPPMINFFLQDFLNIKINKKMNLRRASFSDYILGFIKNYAIYQKNKVDKILSSFRFYHPEHSILEMSKKAEEIISLANQFGEGWLIPAEMASFAQDGINQVVSLQPFGCIANHIISKGIEKKVKELYPQLSLLFLDFDNDISEVNVINRLQFIIMSAREKMEEKKTGVIY